MELPDCQNIQWNFLIAEISSGTFWLPKYPMELSDCWNIQWNFLIAEISNGTFWLLKYPITPIFNGQGLRCRIVGRNHCNHWAMMFWIAWTQPLIVEAGCANSGWHRVDCGGLAAVVLLLLCCWCYTPNALELPAAAQGGSLPWWCDATLPTHTTNVVVHVHDSGNNWAGRGAKDVVAPI